MSNKQTKALLILILLAAFFLRTRHVLTLPPSQDEIESGEIALEIIQGNIAPFYPHGSGRESLYFFTTALAFRVIGDTLLATRLPSLYWGIIFVAGMFGYGRFLFRKKTVGILAAGFTASLWWPVVFSRLGLRAISLPVMSLPVLVGMVGILRAQNKREALRFGWVGGIFSGLLTYTYTAGRGFPLILLAFILYAYFWHRPRWRIWWQPFLLIFGLTAVIGSGLYIFLASVDHPIDQRIEIANYGLNLLLNGDYSAFGGAIKDTLAMFTFRGDPIWFYNISGRPVFPGPEGWLFYLGVLLAIRFWKKPHYALQLILTAAMFFPSLMTIQPPSWTRSVGMLPGIITLTAVAGDWLWQKGVVLWNKTPDKKRPATLINRGFIVLFFLLGATIYMRTAIDLKTWINHPGVYWPTFAFYADTADFINHASDTTPLNYSMDIYTPLRKTNLERLINRDDIEIRWTENNALVFPGRSSIRLAYQLNGSPAKRLQTSFWNPGQPAFIGPRFDTSGTHLLQIFEIPQTILAAHLKAAESRPVYFPGLTRPISERIQVGDVMTFYGYEVLNPQVQEEDALYLLTYWEIQQRPSPLAVFIHLLDASGEIRSQHDGFDALVEDLDPGDMVVQLHTIPLPAGLTPGIYSLQAGVYDRGSLQRYSLNVQTDGNVFWLENWRFDG